MILYFISKGLTIGFSFLFFQFLHRCQIEKLESEKRSLHREITSLRDRVLELGNSLQIRDEELTRERRLNDELSERFDLKLKVVLNG